MAQNLTGVMVMLCNSICVCSWVSTSDHLPYMSVHSSASLLSICSLICFNCLSVHSYAFCLLIHLTSVRSYACVSIQLPFCSFIHMLVSVQLPLSLSICHRPGSWYQSCCSDVLHSGKRHLLLFDHIR